MRYEKHSPIPLLATLVLTFSGLAPVLGTAATLTVDSPTAYVAPDGLCGLVEAIDNANADAPVHADCPAGTGADEILLTADVILDGTDVFAADGDTGLPSLTGETLLDGAGFTISRDPAAPAFRILHVSVGAVAELHRVRISGGLAATGFDNGGGILNAGTLLISESAVENNEVASIFPSGGGIFNSGNLTIANSSVIGNRAADATFAFGGGVYSAGAGGSLTLINAELSENTARQGGGVWTAVATTVDNSRITDNQAQDAGGGMLLFRPVDPISVRINNTVFENNVVLGAGNTDNNGGGAIASRVRDVEIFGSSFRNNAVADGVAGGAILNFGIMTIDASELTGNSVSGTAVAGAIANVLFTSEVRLVGSIVRNNTSATEAGGLYTVSGPFYVSDSLIEGNTATSGGGFAAGSSNGDSFFIKRSSLIGNSASFLGGAGYAVGNLTTSFIDNSTISGNYAFFGGGGIGLNQGGQVQITHTAVIANTSDQGVNSVGGLNLFAGTGSIGSNLIANNPADDCSATNQSTSLDYNISTDDEVTGAFGDDRWCSFLPSAPNDLLETDPLVEPLATNGNVGPTHLLQLGSPAADYIPFDCPPSLEGVDQRGVARPPGTCDVGPVSDEAAVLPLVYFPLASSLIDNEGSFSGTHFVDLVVDNMDGTLPAPGMDLTLNVGIRGTAAPGIDYIADAGIPTIFVLDALDWPAPGTTRTLQIGLTPLPDALVEDAETIELSVRLTGPGVLGAQRTHVVTLVDARQTVYACDGFRPPLADPLAFGNRPPRSIPAKMRVIAPNGVPVGPDELPATPEIFVVAPDGTVYGNYDDDAPLVPVGRSNVENRFAYDPNEAQWHYRIGAGQFPAPGVYTVAARFPSDSDAVFDPTCTQTFERTGN